MGRSPQTSPQVVVALTGASGAAYGVRLVDVLVRIANLRVAICISPPAFEVIAHELGVAVSASSFSPPKLWPDLPADAIDYYESDDFFAPIASGSTPTGGMAICPCSTATLAAVATGVGRNLIHRAAEVHLKERRRLVLVTREMPYSLPMLRNMAAAAEAGAVVMSAAPALYHRPQKVADMIDFVVARVCDQLGVATRLMPAWENQA